MNRKSVFVGHSFELLPVEERIQQYREMADATFLKAQRLEDPFLSAEYFSLAGRWHAMAQALEAGNPDPELIPSERAAPAERQPGKG